MPITIVLRPPTVTCRVKYAPLLIIIYWIIYIVPIYFVPLIDVSGAGNSVYFFFHLINDFMPYPSRNFCREILFSSIFTSMARRIEPNPVLSTPAVVSENPHHLIWEGTLFPPLTSEKFCFAGILWKFPWSASIYVLFMR